MQKRFKIKGCNQSKFRLAFFIMVQSLFWEIFLSRDARVGLDPVQVAGHPSESSWGTNLAAVLSSKGSNTNKGTIQSQGTARITLAGGNGVGCGDANDLAGDHQASEGLLAHGVGNDRQISELQVLGSRGLRIGGHSPSRGNGGLSNVGGVAAGDGRKGDLVNRGRKGHGWGLDQGDVVADGQGNIVGMLDPVGAGESVGELGTGTDSCSIVDGHIRGSGRGRRQITKPFLKLSVFKLTRWCNEQLSPPRNYR